VGNCSAAGGIHPVVSGGRFRIPRSVTSSAPHSVGKIKGLGERIVTGEHPQSHRHCLGGVISTGSGNSDVSKVRAGG